jgi:hypothetical protein
MKKDDERVAEKGYNVEFQPISDPGRLDNVERPKEQVCVSERERAIHSTVDLVFNERDG